MDLPVLECSLHCTPRGYDGFLVLDDETIDAGSATYPPTFEENLQYKEKEPVRSQYISGFIKPTVF